MAARRRGRRPPKYSGVPPPLAEGAHRHKGQLSFRGPHPGPGWYCYGITPQRGSYIKISTSTQGRVKVVDPDTYIPTPGEEATIIPYNAE